VLFPLLWDIKDNKQQKHSRVLFPLVWSIRDDLEQRRCNVLFPLLWDFLDHKKQTRHSVLFPLVWYSNDKPKGARSFVFFPFVWLDKTRRGGGYHFWPLFGRRRDGHCRGLSIAWPLFWYRWNPENGMKKLGLPFPLIYWQTIPTHKSKHFHVVPFWFTQKKDNWFLSLLPLMCARRDDDFKGTAWLWYVAKPQDKQITRHHVVLWQLLTEKRWANGDYDFRILHKLLRSQKKDGYSQFAINPLIRSEHDGDLYRFSLLGPLFQYENDGGRKRLRLLHFLKIGL